MQNNTYVLLSILVMAVVTALLRCLPFFVFGGKRSTSPFITYLGRYLPYAMMGMTIVYQNIVFAIAVKLLSLVLVAAGAAGMWLAIFADVGVMVLAVLNAIRALYHK